MRKLQHLKCDQRVTVADMIRDHDIISGDVPNEADCVIHDIAVGEALPMKQVPYRVNPIKRE